MFIRFQELTRTHARALRVLSAASALALALGTGPAYAANTIQLQGTAGAVCTLSTSTDPQASTLPITTAGAQTITVGTVL